MINDLLKISKYAGMDETIVQAGGGNTSVKTNGTVMFIKASGCSLSDLTNDSGFSQVDYRLLLNSIDKADDEQKILAAATLSGQRPSIESYLHALTKRITLHTHPTLINVLAVRTGGFEELKKLFPTATFVDYTTPGINLARKMFEKFDEYSSKSVQIIFFKNHGMVVSSDSADLVINTTQKIIDDVASYLKVDNSANKNTYELYKQLISLGLIEQDEIVYLSDDYIIQRFLKQNPEGWRYNYCPDCVVYCHRRMMKFHNDISQKDVDAFVDSWGEPNIFIYKGNVYIVAKNVKKAREIESVLRMSAEISMLNCKHGIDFLTKAEQDSLLGWESEKYRQSI